jgi:hypothetical protein
MYIMLADSDATAARAQYRHPTIEKMSEHHKRSQIGCRLVAYGPGAREL